MSVEALSVEFTFTDADLSVRTRLYEDGIEEAWRRASGGGRRVNVLAYTQAVHILRQMYRIGTVLPSDADNIHAISGAMRAKDPLGNDLPLLTRGTKPGDVVSHFGRPCEITNRQLIPGARWEYTLVQVDSRGNRIGAPKTVER